MNKSNQTSGKAGRITYWIATLWLALGMVSTGLVQILHMKEGTGGMDSMIQLGYPVYLLTLLGTLKILGVVTILIPRLPLLKEWAYAGFLFLLTGAAYSHIASGEAWSSLFPAFLLCVLLFLSWYFRPASRKFIITTSLNSSYEQQKKVVGRSAESLA